MKKAPRAEELPRGWHYAPLDEAEQANVRKLLADPAYKTAVDWLLYKCCKLADLPYRSDSVRDTDFGLGMWWVGKQFVRAATLPVKPKPVEPQKRRSTKGVL